MRSSHLLSVFATFTLACFAAACDGGSTTTTGNPGGSAGDGGSGGSGADGGSGGSGATGATGGSGGTGGSAAMCGNGTVEGDEQCDEGNANSDTGACKTDCTSASCGDSFVQDGVEDCDNGPENADTAACTSSCKAAACGDGFIQDGVEECDGGPDNSDTGECTTQCKKAACGDGFVLAGGEECDDGAANSDTAACTAACKTAVCGDGLIHAGVEGCDDMNMVNTDGCTNMCTLPACGDGVVQMGEDCDLGAGNSNSGACTLMCKNAVCGDGLTQTGVEECDNGAANSNMAACTAMCKAAKCGDGFTQTGVEECDNGAANSNTAACTLMCKGAVCGDGFIQAGVEACDDANTVNGDGCNNNCVAGGTTIWTQTYNGVANLADGWNAVTTDAAGNIYVTGFEGTATQALNVVTRKYTAAGAIQWTAQYNGAGNGNDEGFGIAVDAAGNVYVTGYAQVSATDIDVLVLKYNGANGSQIFAQTLNGLPDEVDVGTAIAVNPANGNVYGVGYAAVTAGVGSDVIVAKLEPATGLIVALDVANGAGNLDDFANGVTVDASGAIIAAGALRTASNYDTWIRKYTDLGSSFGIVWTRTFNGASNADDAAFGVTTDGMSAVLVSGIETVNGQGNNAWVRKYDSAGTTLWTQTFNAPANLNDRALGIHADTAGNSIVCGFQPLANTTADVWVRKYTPAGATVWTQSHNGSADQDDVGNGCRIAPAGQVIVGGYETVSGPNTNAWLRTYEQ